MCRITPSVHCRESYKHVLPSGMYSVYFVSYKLEMKIAIDILVLTEARWAGFEK